MVMETRSGKGNEEPASLKEDKQKSDGIRQKIDLKKEWEKQKQIQQDTSSVKIKKETLEENINIDVGRSDTEDEEYVHTKKRSVELVDVADQSTQQKNEIKLTSPTREEIKRSTTRTSKRRFTVIKYPKRNKKYFQDIRNYAQLLNNGSMEGDEQYNPGEEKAEKVVPDNNREEIATHKTRLEKLIENVGIECLQFEKK